MPIGVALLGCGTVGTAVAEMLLNEAQHLTQRSGARLQLRHVLVRDPARVRSDAIPRRLFTTDIKTIFADEQTRVVVEVIGGIEPARAMLLKALRSGRNVVTANKHLLAMHGEELFAAARAGRSVGFEASCGGAIPIVLALSHGLLANDISRVIGIVNGTCNYILTQMHQAGTTFAQALAEAQAAGYAETDPTMDISGTDSAHKLAVLAALAFGARVPFSAIDVAGIATLQDADLRYARELGYVCKLLAIAEKSGNSISLRVRPALVPQGQLLANVNGPFNAISVLGHASGETLYYGRGAGPRPTASAVLADILELANDGHCMPPPRRRAPLAFLPIDRVVSRHYLRLTALDVPGVMAQVTRILGDNGISLSAIVQHEASAGDYVPVVITTHQAADAAISRAVKQIDALESIRGNTVRIRVVESSGSARRGAVRRRAVIPGATP